MGRKFPTRYALACGDIARAENASHGASVTVSIPSPSMGSILVRSIDWRVSEGLGRFVEVWFRSIRKAKAHYLAECVRLECSR